LYSLRERGSQFAQGLPMPSTKRSVFHLCHRQLVFPSWTRFASRHGTLLGTQPTFDREPGFCWRQTPHRQRCIRSFVLFSLTARLALLPRPVRYGAVRGSRLPFIFFEKVSCRLSFPGRPAFKPCSAVPRAVSYRIIRPYFLFLLEMYLIARRACDWRTPFPTRRFPHLGLLPRGRGVVGNPRCPGPPRSFSLPPLPCLFFRLCMTIPFLTFRQRVGTGGSPKQRLVRFFGLLEDENFSSFSSSTASLNRLFFSFRVEARRYAERRLFSLPRGSPPACRSRLFLAVNVAPHSGVACYLEA